MSAGGSWSVPITDYLGSNKGSSSVRGAGSIGDSGAIGWTRISGRLGGASAIERSGSGRYECAGRTGGSGSQVVKIGKS